jgi:hypothetical protein
MDRKGAASLAPQCYTDRAGHVIRQILLRGRWSSKASSAGTVQVNGFGVSGCFGREPDTMRLRMRPNRDS